MIYLRYGVAILLLIGLAVFDIGQAGDQQYHHGFEAGACFTLRQCFHHNGVDETKPDFCNRSRMELEGTKMKLHKLTIGVVLIGFLVLGAINAYQNRVIADQKTLIEQMLDKPMKISVF